MAKRETKHRAEQYAEDVRSGKIVACHWVKRAVERYYSDLDQALDKGWVFSRKSAVRAINIIERLRYTDGVKAGEYITLEGWELFIVWNLFGWLMSDNKTRRFLESYVEVARKNGKSTLASAIALVMLIFDGEIGAQVYSAATTRDQARICFKAAQDMARRSDLRNYVVLTRDAIAYEPLGASYKPLSSEARNLDGWSPHCVILDEFHAHRDNSVYQVLRTGMGARRHPLMFIITTAGLDTSVPCFAYRKVMCQVLDGTITADRTFTIIYTLDDVGEVDDPAMWIKANPCLGVSLREDWLREQYDAMKRDPSMIVDTMTKNFNIWMDAPTVWIPDAAWSGIKSIVPMEALAGQKCVAALDLASVNDYSAFCLMFNVNGRYQFLWRFYIPEDKYRNRAEMQRENANIEAWVRNDLITVTPGNVTDYDYIIRDIAELSEIYDIIAIAYDPWNSSTIVPKLVEQGANMQPFTQTISNYAMPTKEFERIVGLGIVDHYDNPVARWMLSNVVIREDVNGNRRPDKKKSSEKIDGIVAAIMALGQSMSDRVTEQHIYERRGILGFDDEDDTTEGNNLYDYDNDEY